MKTFLFLLSCVALLGAGCTDKAEETTEETTSGVRIERIYERSCYEEDGELGWCAGACEEPVPCLEVGYSVLGLSSYSRGWLYVPVASSTQEIAEAVKRQRERVCDEQEKLYAKEQALEAKKEEINELLK